MKIDVYAMRLLRFRPRSVSEMHNRLKVKGFKNDEITQTINRLKSQGLLDDRQFAKFWTKERELTSGYGSRRIRWELRAKGVSDKLINEAISEFETENDEYAAACAFAEKKLRLLREKDNVTKKRKLYAVFLRRGFSPETIDKIISRTIPIHNDLQ